MTTRLRLVAAEDSVEFRMLQIACGQGPIDSWFHDFLRPEAISADAFQTRLRAAYRPWEIVLAPTRKSVIQEVKGATALVVERQRVDHEILDAAECLRTVIVYGSDTSLIDKRACAERGITVGSVSRRTSSNVADHTMAMLLALTRQLLDRGRVDANNLLGAVPASTEEGGHPPTLFNWQGVTGLDALEGRRFGVLGAGEIGQRVLKRAAAFEMEVGYVARRPVPHLESSIGAKRLTLNQLPDWAEILSLHVPYSPALRHVIGADALRRLGPRGIVLNVSRGLLIDTDALVSALRRGCVAGAGLDVFPQEPIPRGHPLLLTPNVVLTPHIAGGSRWNLVADVISTIHAVDAGLRESA